MLEMQRVIETLEQRRDEAASHLAQVESELFNIQDGIIDAIELFKGHFECFPFEFPSVENTGVTVTNYGPVIEVRFAHWGGRENSFDKDTIEYLLHKYMPEKETKIGNAEFGEDIRFNYNGKSFDWVLYYTRMFGDVRLDFSVNFYYVPVPDADYSTLIELGKLAASEPSKPELHLTC